MLPKFCYQFRQPWKILELLESLHIFINTFKSKRFYEDINVRVCLRRLKKNVACLHEVLTLNLKCIQEKSPKRYWYALKARREHHELQKTFRIIESDKSSLTLYLQAGSMASSETTEVSSGSIASDMRSTD